jgi:PAS domain S-box-containing protein
MKTSERLLPVRSICALGSIAYPLPDCYPLCELGLHSQGTHAPRTENADTPLIARGAVCLGTWLPQRPHSPKAPTHRLSDRLESVGGRMPEAEIQQRNQSFVDEVISRFGVLPNFFCSAPTADGLIQDLWKFAKSGYLDCPLPSLFKERLFVHLSRFCEVRYCIVRHVGFLIGEGYPAGDASVLPQTIEQVLTLLRRPVPDVDALSRCLERLESHRHPVEMPEAETQLEGDLFDALTIIFIEPARSERARRAVSCAFGESRFEILTAFLAFVRTAHYWTETHPTLACEDDMLAVLAKHSDLERLLLDRTEAEQVKAGEALRRTLTELQEMRGERTRVEEALRLSEERLAAALRAARMAFWVWDPATDTVSASDTMDELFGLPPGERFRSSADRLELVHPEDLPAHRAKVEAAAREDGGWHQDFRIIRPRDGQVAWLTERAHVTRDSHGNRVMTGLVWDVTERKLLESSLQDADRRKDEFLATLAHELRNPLAPLRNGMQIARLTSKGDSRFERTIEMMDRQLTHLVHLVDDLLDVGRISSGKIELRRDQITLSEILSSGAEAARTAIDTHGHELIVEPAAEELWVAGDFDRCTQIFSNLLTNAAKYTERGGKIVLRVAREGDCAVVSVSDNGIGIPSADLPHVFELFSQVRLHQGRAEGGLGIGLSIVRRLVEMHRGTVSVTSQGSGKGSTFTVRLPVISGGATTPVRVNAQLPPPVSPRRILVVDDNTDAASSLSVLLEHQGHQVATAHDGAEAVAKARILRPQIVFLDLGMPRMDGLEAARHLRSLANGEPMLLVALTGWGQKQDQQRTREAGFDVHLVKPINRAELDKVLAASPTSVIAVCSRTP